MKTWKILGWCLLVSLTTKPLRATITLPAIFSDGMVLQKSPSTPVWGRGEPNEKIAVDLASVKAVTTADAQGQWRTNLDLSGIGPGPFSLSVQGSSAVEVKNVLVGQVWLCSGQSNMEFTLNRASGGREEIASSTNPKLRQFLVRRVALPNPTQDLAGTWIEVSPSTAANFTAVGYFFGKKLQHELDEPVGLINSSWGGTPIEAWLGSRAFEKNAELQIGKARIQHDAATFSTLQEEFARKFSSWTAQYNRADQTHDPASYMGQTIDETSWSRVQMPTSFSEVGLPRSGAIWLRRRVDIPKDSAHKDLELRLGVIHDYDTVYWNGQHVAGIAPNQPGAADERRYRVPASLVMSGTATLAIRIFSPGNGGGIEAYHAPFLAGTIHLGGPWLAEAEYELPKLSAEAAQAEPEIPKKPLQNSNQPSYLFNGMIYPLVPYAIRGILWYQGEQNTSRGYLYRTELPLLIGQMRDLWGKNLPFYFCQLPNFGAQKSSAVEDSKWADLRESQSLALALPQTGMAVLIDTGNGDMHPPNKKDVGERLAAIALAKTYDRNIPYAGPRYQSMAIEGGKIRLHFDQSDLVAGKAPTRDAQASKLEGFAISDANAKWVPAEARIEAGSVVVWSPSIPSPAAVRYAWSNNPTCNLYNAAGYPASPFRTDAYSLGTQGKKY